MKRIVEFRAYKLKPGTGASFHELIANRSAELVRNWGMDVVAFGQSAEDPDAYLLVRAYDSIEHLQKSQEQFYATEAWREGLAMGAIGGLLFWLLAIFRNRALSNARWL